jgi:chemotaxis protein MotA
MITIGGTIAAMIVTFPRTQLFSFGSVMKKVFQKEDQDPVNDISMFSRMSDVIRKEGVLSLDGKISEFTDDEFLKKGIMLLVDGKNSDVIRSNMATELKSMQRRHKKGAAMLDMISKTTPSLGLLCTYVGLIPMLQNLTNPEALGPMMAIELVSSFYGSFIAYVLFGPMANRLKLMDQEESLRKEMMIYGLSAVSEGLNPHQIEDQMMNYLSRKEIARFEKKHKMPQNVTPISKAKVS